MVLCSSHLVYFLLHNLFFPSFRKGMQVAQCFHILPSTQGGCHLSVRTRRLTCLAVYWRIRRPTFRASGIFWQILTFRLSLRIGRESIVIKSEVGRLKGKQTDGFASCVDNSFVELPCCQFCLAAFPILLRI